MDNTQVKEDSTGGMGLTTLENSLKETDTVMEWRWTSKEVSSRASGSKATRKVCIFTFLQKV